MAITVKFFARLREDVGKSEQTLDFEPDMSVADVWERAAGTGELPENVLVSVNMEYVRDHVALKDGDEVGFFPAVTGG